jgi:hypothetical protein
MLMAVKATKRKSPVTRVVCCACSGTSEWKSQPNLNEGRMLMPNCPSCHRRLPLTEVLGGGGTVCPYCNSELEPSRWGIFVSVILTMLGCQAGFSFAKGASLNFIAQLVSGGAAGLVVGNFAAVFLVRYRIREAKGPLLKL